jgi:hypothetical protein
MIYKVHRKRRKKKTGIVILDNSKVKVLAPARKQTGEILQNIGRRYFGLKKPP